MQVPDPKEGFLLSLCLSLCKEHDLLWKLSSLKVVVYERRCMKKRFIRGFRNDSPISLCFGHISLFYFIVNEFFKDILSLSPSSPPLD